MLELFTLPSVYRFKDNYPYQAAYSELIGF